MNVLDRLAALEPRRMKLLLAGCVALAALAAWLYVIKAPLQEYRRLGAERARLEQALTEQGRQAGDLPALQREVRELAERVGTAEAAGDPRAAVVPLMTRLGAAARSAGVQLGAVRFYRTGSLAALHQVSYEAEARGPYAALGEWLRAVEQGMSPMVVTQMGLTAEPSGEVAMRLVLSRLTPGAPAGARP